MNQIILDRVTVQRSKKTLLNDVTTNVTAGQIVGILGPNGAGKSTLLNAIAQQTSFTGRIDYDYKTGQKVQIGFLPQSTIVDADLTVMETVLLGFHGQLGYLLKPDQINAVCEILEEFGISNLSGRLMQTLSGGQQQLVLLAQRLIRQPQLLILDESTSALDTYRQLQVFQLLRKYVLRTGALVLISIHDLNLAARHTDYALLLCDGNLVEAGTFNQIITKETIKKAYGIEVELLKSSSGHSVIFPIGVYKGKNEFL